MRWLSDRVVDRLQSALQCPDLSATRYRAIRFLARGAMGTVWLAQDTALDRQVALKILDLTDRSGELAARLMREARIMARLEHPGIVPVHDAGTLADGRVFYSMKYVKGERLDRYVAHLNSLPERLRLLERVAEPLAFAHSKGILHRDLKPENIMIGPFGEVLVMDWGVARIKEGARSPGPSEPNADGDSTPAAAAIERPDTAHGSVLGTPGYMSPEQAQGETDLIDERTDVFALGAILSFLLTGQAPGPDSPARGSSPIPRPLSAICARAMAADRSARYANTPEMASDIARYLEGLPVTAYRESWLERAARLFARHRFAVVLVAAYLLMRFLFILLSRR